MVRTSDFRSRSTRSDMLRLQNDALESACFRNPAHSGNGGTAQAHQPVTAPLTASAMQAGTLRVAAVLPRLVQTALTFSKFDTRKPCQGYFALSPCN
jgi:hypothetical protein